MKTTHLLGLCLGLAACGPSVESFTRPDYAEKDQGTIKRLAIVVAPAPAGNAVAGKMWSLVARRWANQHRNFIVRRNVVAESFDRAAVCEGMQGAIWLEPKVTPESGGFELDLDAQLVRCADGEQVWTAQVAGSFESDDEDLVELRRYYETELGPEAGPQVAAAMHAVRAAFETLPQPKLTEEDEMEKIELGE